ncbi:hypothetical protein BGZ60DRAFT_421777 [Tricladium varicosporioides]|nr:hypothetical protein BGZ60DRAFT_421777 [Hymenoscyphus varicosporioides]
MTLSTCMGFGILLLGSSEAMRRINNTEFTDEMFDTLICYVFNIYPEIPRLWHKLDIVVRQMVKNQTVAEMRFYVEDLVPSIESFLESRGDLRPLSKFVRVDPSTYQADPLELFPVGLRNRTSLNQYLRAEGAEMYREERASGSACKRRRISL